eukprot:CAMPEP_0202394062 /NCGR_PEP_ID=MMETSP1127-20130417/93232_1 /ASSEMBLY_ACC=CAM_ASM_000462 /TAXON_ID=3047 /ORGANISM="Dunaliella tertiolecta, Strain CCMP1320" /LENGTH=44 /DNA_ID= /DNA_START= /DNA_END= /DNA_ORIENTATION=
MEPQGAKDQAQPKSIMEHVAADAAATRVEADMRLGELALGTIST